MNEFEHYITLRTTVSIQVHVWLAFGIINLIGNVCLYAVLFKILALGSFCYSWNDFKGHWRSLVVTLLDWPYVDFCGFYVCLCCVIGIFINSLWQQIAYMYRAVLTCLGALGPPGGWGPHEGWGRGLRQGIFQDFEHGGVNQPLGVPSLTLPALLSYFLVSPPLSPSTLFFPSIRLKKAPQI